MLKTLKINNFQSHKKTFLKFSKGINLICGKTDSGKSSVRRALEWAIKNKPSGDSFRSSWGGDTSVEIGFKKKNIKRIKGDSKNEYELNGQKYKAFGQNIPEDISQLINIDGINIQRQFDPIFLFSKSPGEVAKYFNETIDIDIIDKAQINILKIIRKEFNEIERQKQEKINLKKEFDSFSWIKKVEEKIIVLENLKSIIQKEKENFDFAQKVLNEIENIKVKEKEINQTIKFEFEIKKLIEDWKKFKIEKEKLNVSEGYLQQIFLYITDKKYVEDSLKKNNKILKEALKNNCPLCGRRKI